MPPGSHLLIRPMHQAGSSPIPLLKTNAMVIGKVAEYHGNPAPFAGVVFIGGSDTKQDGKRI